MQAIEGNHAFRLHNYLIQNAKGLYGLPGVSAPDFFGLWTVKIDYIVRWESAIGLPITSSVRTGFMSAIGPSRP